MCLSGLRICWETGGSLRDNMALERSALARPLMLYPLLSQSNSYARGGKRFSLQYGALYDDGVAYV
jgi:hypothetical protein